VVRHADVVAAGDDAVAGRKVGAVALEHLTREIDADHERRDPRDATLLRRSERVLVVHARAFDAHEHASLAEGAGGQLLDPA